MTLPVAILEKLKIQKATVTSLYTNLNETFLVEGAESNSKAIVKHRREFRTDDYSPYSEMVWLDGLSKNGFPCVQPFLPGFFSLNVIKEQNDIFSLYKYIEGKEPDRAETENYRQAGAMLRQLHQLSSQIINTLDKAAKERPVYDATFVIDRFIPEIQNSDLFNEETKRELMIYAEKIKNNFPADRQFIHGDFHFGNMIQNEKGLHLLDFDECGFGSIYYDIGTIKLHTLAAKNLKIWEAFLKGYGTLHLNQKDLVYGIAARIFYLVGYIPQRVALVEDLASRVDDVIARYTRCIRELIS